MAAPRPTPAIAKTAASARPGKPAAAAANPASSAAKSTSRPRATLPGAIQPAAPPRSFAPEPGTPAIDSAEVARMLHELRVNGEALSVQIARLAQRFL